MASVKELRNQSLSAAEKQKLATYAGDLRWWLSGLDAGQPDDQQRTARLADLGLTTDGRRQVVGVGPVLRLRVIVPDDGKFYLADGAAWSYAERLAPAREPQSDAAWQAAWLGQEPPGLPEWTSTFTSAGATALPVGAKAGRP